MADIRVRGLSKKFRNPAGVWIPILQNIDVTVPSGRIFCLSGANGAGKTTLLKILATAILPDEGQLLVGGFDVVRQKKRVRRLIGWAAADAGGFYPALTVGENLIFFAALFGMGAVDCRARVKQLESHWPLHAEWDQSVQSLSSGNRQRVSLLRALMHDPAVLLLDEPTAHFDPASATAFQNQLKSFASPHSKRSVVCVSQSADERRALNGSEAILSAGRLVSPSCEATLSVTAPS